MHSKFNHPLIPLPQQPTHLSQQVQSLQHSTNTYTTRFANAFQKKKQDYDKQTKKLKYLCKDVVCQVNLYFQRLQQELDTQHKQQMYDDQQQVDSLLKEILLLTQRPTQDQVYGLDRPLLFQYMDSLQAEINQNNSTILSQPHQIQTVLQTLQSVANHQKVPALNIEASIGRFIQKKEDNKIKIDNRESVVKPGQTVVSNSQSKSLFRVKRKDSPAYDLQQHLVIYCPEQSCFQFLDPLHHKLQAQPFSADSLNNDLPMFCSVLPDLQNQQLIMVNNGYQPFPCPTPPRVDPSEKVLVCRNNQVSLHSTLPSPRLKSACGLVEGEAIYLFGGVLTQAQLRTNTCLRITLDGQVHQIDSMKQVRVGASACIMAKDFKKDLFRVRVINPSKNQEMIKLQEAIIEDQRQKARQHREFKQDKDWHLYVFGGSMNEYQLNPSIEVYSVNLQKWVHEYTPRSHYQPRTGHFSCQISDTHILILGGRISRHQRTSHIELLDTLSGDTTQLGHIPGDRSVEVDGRVTPYPLVMIYNSNLFVGTAECHSPMYTMLSVGTYDILNCIVDGHQQLHFQHRHCQ